MTNKRITREQRMDWRNLPYDDWNTLTVQAYFEDMNRERFGIEKYVPMRNYRFEQGVIKRALDEYGAKVLRRACDEVFRTYRPNRQWPILTAGFAIAYRVNSVIPNVMAEIERERSELERADEGGQDVESIIGYL